MAQCIHCKAETALHDGTPVCLLCANDTPENRNLTGKLIRDLAEATLAAEAASIEFRAVMGNIPSGTPHPDGTQRIHNVSRRMKVARDEIIKAHRRLNNFIEHGIVPLDLKGGG
jgi:hypothetical protein